MVDPAKRFLALLCVLGCEFPILFGHVILISTPVDYRIMLGHYDSALSNGPKFTTSKLVYEMVEAVVILLLALDVLNGQLQLALHLTQEHVVYENVVILGVQFVLDAYQFEEVMHLL